MTTKQIFLLGLILLSQASQAADNSIFIDQAGDNATITMLQDGASNRVRAIQGVGTGNTTPSRLRGDALVLSIQQIGSGNILNMGVDTTTANGRAGLINRALNRDPVFVAAYKGTGVAELEKKRLALIATASAQELIDGPFDSYSNLMAEKMDSLKIQSAPSNEDLKIILLNSNH